MIALSLLLALTAHLPSNAAVQDTTAASVIVTIDKDEHQRYIVHAPAADVQVPKNGWKLLVVMPGGSGSEDFTPFVGRIRENALSDEWIVLQLIAPVWSEAQAQTNVWPTKLNPWPKMKFDCEHLFAAALKDVAKKHPLNPRYLFTLAWSSSGSLAYTLALAKNSSVTGTFIAMSVYKPDLLPKLKHAKGRRFHILHSPTDFIPITMAEKAREQLEEKKALVNYATYEGGHGWHGNVFGMLRIGLEWLEVEAQKAKLRKGAK